MMRTRFAAGVGFVLACGCSSWVSTNKVPPAAAIVAIAQTPSAMPAAIATVSVTSGGVDVPPSSGFLTQLETKLRASRLFPEVTQTPNPPIGAVRLDISAVEVVDSNQGTNVLKGFIIGLSMYTLAPALPANAEYSITLTMRATRPDGQARTYTSSASSTAYSHLFGNGAQAVNEAIAVTMNGALNDLVSQLALDSTFFASA